MYRVCAIQDCKSVSCKPHGGQTRRSFAFWSCPSQFRINTQQLSMDLKTHMLNKKIHKINMATILYLE